MLSIKVKELFVMNLKVEPNQLKFREAGFCGYAPSGFSVHKFLSV
jgi:hypothetical protein